MQALTNNTNTANQPTAPRERTNWFVNHLVRVHVQGPLGTLQGGLVLKNVNLAWQLGS